VPGFAEQHGRLVGVHGKRLCAGGVFLAGAVEVLDRGAVGAVDPVVVAAAAYLAHVATSDSAGYVAIVDDAKQSDRLDKMLYGITQLFFDGNPNLYRSPECIQVWGDVANNYASYDDGTNEGDN